MDEEDMDDKEEQSEESRAVRVGQKKMMTPTLAEREEHERTPTLPPETYAVSFFGIK